MTLSETALFVFGNSIVKLTAALLVVTFLAVKLASITMGNKKRYNLPPGPRGLPLVGYLPFFGKDPPTTFLELRKTYGDVIGITMGSFRAVVLCGRDTIREALVTKGDDFSGKPAFYTAMLMEGGKSNLALGPIWKMHRKIVSNVLATFSDHRHQPIEDIIRSEARIVADKYLAHGGKSFCPLDQLETAAFGIVFQLCYGRTQNIRENKAFLGLVSDNARFREFIRAGNPVDIMPWLRHLMPGKIRSFLALMDDSMKSFESIIQEHFATYNESNLRDIADGLIYAADHLTAKEKAVGLDKKRVLESLNLVFGAGGTTSAVMLQWTVCLMAAYPEIQQKIFDEIKRVVGRQRDIRLSDREKLPLVEATTFEVLRFTGALRLALPHATIRDTTLGGYDIPEGTVVLINHDSIVKDKDLWGDPENFRPERFLNSQGLLERSLLDQVHAFSMGKRRCPGEFLARTNIFLFFATLLQSVKFSKPPGQRDYTFEWRFGLVNEILPYEVCVSARE